MVSTLYHYCTLDSLLGIVQNRCLWASDARFLNDRKEVSEAKERIQRSRDFVERRIRGFPGCAEVLDSLDRVCGSEHLLFVISFSEVEDNLSQWRCYGDRGRGVCLGFDEPLVRSLGHRLGRMLYGADELLEAVIQASIEHAQREVRTAADNEALDRRFTEIMALSKHSAFADEREVRLLFLDGDPGVGERRFRRSGQFITSYRPISLEPLWEREVLKKLCVGPCQHEEATKWALIQFLVEMGTPRTVVHDSKAPFREW